MENTSVMGSQSPSYSSTPQGAKPAQANMANVMAYQTAFPEIYYKLQPYVMMVCDQLESFGTTMPSQEMLDNISDSIYDDMCKRYPDLAEYARTQEAKANSDPAIQAARFGDDPPPFGFGFGFRRRGLARDLIEILLLSELFRRRRRYY